MIMLMASISHLLICQVLCQELLNTMISFDPHSNSWGRYIIIPGLLCLEYTWVTFSKYTVKERMDKEMGESGRPHAIPSPCHVDNQWFQPPPLVITILRQTLFTKLKKICSKGKLALIITLPHKDCFLISYFLFSTNSFLRTDVLNSFVPNYLLSTDLGGVI